MGKQKSRRIAEIDIASGSTIRIFNNLEDAAFQCGISKAGMSNRIHRKNVIDGKKYEIISDEKEERLKKFKKMLMNLKAKQQTEYIDEKSESALEQFRHKPYKCL